MKANQPKYSEKQLDEARRSSAREVNVLFLHLLPGLPAYLTPLVTESGRFAYDVNIPFLAELFEEIGRVAWSYTIVLSYLLLTAIFRWSFYKELSTGAAILASWLAWGWFYYSAWYLDNLKMAYIGLLAMSLLMVRTVGVLLFCYGKIREGMFFGDTKGK